MSLCRGGSHAFHCGGLTLTFGRLLCLAMVVVVGVVVVVDTPCLGPGRSRSCCHGRTRGV